MKILTEINTKINLRTHIIKGAIDIVKITGYLKELYSSSDFNSEMNVIWDLREADFSSISSKEVKSLMEYVGKRWGKSGNNKAALIVSQDLDYGMSRMYQILMEGVTPSQISIFKDINEAKEWM